MQTDPASRTSGTARAWALWGGLLGFALGGFFDGILLHQILQWHHLLSLVPGLEEIRLQILWDGYFHALMYALAALGLAGLWRARRAAGAQPGRRLAGVMLIGFGAWHVIDTLLSHWVLGIHRIKVDAEMPLLWDLLWLVVFGLVPLALGAVLAEAGPGAGGRPRSASTAALLVAALIGGAGFWASRPPPDQPLTMVVFRAGTGAEAMERQLASLGARMVWADPYASVALTDIAAADRWSLYRRGALLVSGAGLPPGCFGWSEA